MKQAKRFHMIGLVSLLILGSISVSSQRSAVGSQAVTTLSFVSDTIWEVFDVDPATGAAPIGFAQQVCLNSSSPSPCPLGAILYGYGGGGWGANLSSIPGASWIWAPGITGATSPAFPAEFFFSKAFNLPGLPTAGTISVAVDDFAEVYVNGIFVGTTGSVTDGSLAFAAQSSLATFNILPFLLPGTNVITIRAANGPFGCGSGSYNCNPSGVVFGGSLQVSNQPPVAMCQDVMVSAGPSCTANASINNGSFDPDGDPITLSQSPPGPYPLGDTTVTLIVEDENGATDACTATVTVADDTPPVIALSGAPITLWPPNHKYVTVNVSHCVVSASDDCDPTVDVNDVVIAAVSSDEPEDAAGNGDGNTLNDIVIASGCQSVQLRAECAGNGNGRVYTITFRVRDAAGNETTASCKVTVPHDQDPGSQAVNDGPAYTVTSPCP